MGHYFMIDTSLQEKFSTSVRIETPLMAKACMAVYICRMRPRDALEMLCTDTCWLLQGKHHPRGNIMLGEEVHFALTDPPMPAHTLTHAHATRAGV